MPGYTVVIPARYDSRRLPGKPLLDIAGKPMLQWVWEVACSSGASEVLVATDDERISKVATAFGARVKMTSGSHKSGTDRVAEVVADMDDEQVVVNMQGDEPLLPPELLDKVAISLVTRPQAHIVTLAENFAATEQRDDSAAVKVVLAADGRALYFSRAAVPWSAAGDSTVPCLRHIGVYAYRAAFLRQFVKLPQVPLEQYESLEQLRALCHGYYIYVETSSQNHGRGVDTETDLQRVRGIFEKQQQ